MNNYFYANLAHSANLNALEDEQTLSAIDCFEDYRKAEDVKEFLFNEYGIVGSVNKYSVWRNCALTVKENDNQYIVKLECSDETRLYYYNV